MLGLLWLCLCFASFAKCDDAVISTAEERFVESSNAFALHVYRYLSASEGNIFFCPLCLSSSLTFLLEKSAGKTRIELNNTLQYRASKLDEESVRKSFAEINKKIQEQECFATATNGLFLQETDGLEGILEDAHQKTYSTVVKTVDFAGNPQKAAWDLNEWVKLRTQSQIKRMVEWLDPTISMLLASGVYLKTQFAGLFPQRLMKRERFRNHGVGDHIISVPMMTLKGQVQKIATSYDFRALELPCAGTNSSSIKMWIFLPHRVDSLSEAEDGLRTSMFAQLPKSFKEYKMDIALPKVRIEYFKDFTKVLQQVGVQQSFSAEHASFPHIKEKGAFHLSQVLHKAVIDITEHKTDDQSIPPPPQPEEDTKNDSFNVPQFSATHPFLFFVMDVSSGLILYMGRLLEF